MIHMWLHAVGSKLVWTSWKAFRSGEICMMFFGFPCDLSRSSKAIPRRGRGIPDIVCWKTNTFSQTKTIECRVSNHDDPRIMIIFAYWRSMTRFSKVCSVAQQSVNTVIGLKNRFMSEHFSTTGSQWNDSYMSQNGFTMPTQQFHITRNTSQQSSSISFCEMTARSLQLLVFLPGLFDVNGLNMVN